MENDIKQFTRQALTLALADYERGHPVESYIVDNCHVWPLFRAILGFGIERDYFTGGNVGNMFLTPNPESQRSTLLIKGYFERLRKDYRHVRRSLGVKRRRRQDRLSLEQILSEEPERNDRPDAKSRDVVILTISGRRVEKGGRLYDIYSDPMVELLQSQNITSLVWEHGEERWPRYSKSAWISKRLNLESIKFYNQMPIPEPKWFSELSHWALGICGRGLSWKNFENIIKQVLSWSFVYEEWLRKVEPCVLICVNWYNPLMIAAVLAAHRLDVQSADLQHGLMDEFHYAYGHWIKTPDEGYPTVPKFFWCWGKDDLAMINGSSPALIQNSQALVGGNLWFNKWRDGCDSDISREVTKLTGLGTKCRKCILIALQGPWDPHELMLQTVSGSPQDWIWLIRFHPSIDLNDRKTISKQYLQTGHPGVEFALANDSALYALLNSINLVITGSSTCALEGLGFGVPAVIVDENGFRAYQKYIDSGVMFYADSPDGLINAIRDSEKLTPEVCQQAVKDRFASAEAAIRSLKVLMGS